jgi:hypothetical protein
MSRQANTEATHAPLLDVAVESWRFTRVFIRMMSKLDAGEKARFESQLRWYVKRLTESLEASGLRLENVEGQLFDPGMAATPLNAADFGPDEELVVEQMLEPIIMGPEGLLRAGTVMLRKVAR